MNRVSIFGGESSGKSTAAAYLFSQLKIKGYSVELVPEWVKTWAYEKRVIDKLDQCYVFAKQFRYEHRFLSNGVPLIITDSPVLLSAIYSHYFGYDSISKNIKELCAEYEEEYPSFNILLDRGDNVFKEEGRYRNIEEALKIDRAIEYFLDQPEYAYKTIKLAYNDYEGMLREVESRLEK
jgi:thymidylate kinase